MKRLLGSDASTVLKLTAPELKQAIQASEGRIICTETVATHSPLIDDLSNAEVAVAYGSNLILLNGFDVFHPEIKGVGTGANVVTQLRELVGRPVGINLEPIDTQVNMLEDRDQIAVGRTCTMATIKAAGELGVDFICLTGNPGTGVSTEQIYQSIALVKANFQGLIIAGKMHGGGANEAVIPEDEILQGFVAQGADIVLMPAVGTVPGLTEAMAYRKVQLVHQAGALALSAIGTSQEGADRATIREIALTNKRCGFDIQHLGDAGFSGVALVENIYQMSLTIRGLRHTISTIARSIKR
ncbi:DUF7916 family protein [Lapidilactobacillus wuchangensis]|uniref:DUF7916 family protein n=1 Tax=Lapidilactobacillus wuchangensis TaxID=2486001 RepID=UPI000F77574D|nr:haloacid dehalogenase-like hydrolase [Lapidilactobacillus wuchangensis]